MPLTALQRFRFCGDQDCPDWLLAEITLLAKIVRGTRVISFVYFCFNLSFVELTGPRMLDATAFEVELCE